MTTRIFGTDKMRSFIARRHDVSEGTLGETLNEYVEVVLGPPLYVLGLLDTSRNGG